MINGKCHDPRQNGNVLYQHPQIQKLSDIYNLQKKPKILLAAH